MKTMPISTPAKLQPKSTLYLFLAGLFKFRGLSTQDITDYDAVDMFLDPSVIIDELCWAFFWASLGLGGYYSIFLC